MTWPLGCAAADVLLKGHQWLSWGQYQWCDERKLCGLQRVTPRCEHEEQRFPSLQVSHTSLPARMWKEKEIIKKKKDSSYTIEHPTGCVLFSSSAPVSYRMSFCHTHKSTPWVMVTENTQIVLGTKHCDVCSFAQGSVTGFTEGTRFIIQKILTNYMYSYYYLCIHPSIHHYYITNVKIKNAPNCNSQTTVCLLLAIPFFFINVRTNYL